MPPDPDLPAVERICTEDGAKDLGPPGAYQSEDSTRPDAVEIVVRGRHTEIDMGSAKPGDDTSFKVSTSCSYYKLSINSEAIIEIDFINMIEKVGGDDLLAGLRTAIGL